MSESPRTAQRNPEPAVHGLRRLFHRHLWVRQRPATRYGYVEDCLRCGKTRAHPYFLICREDVGGA